MTESTSPLPCSWSEWIESLAESKHISLNESGAVLRESKQFAEVCGISLEASTAIMLWVGSVAMLNHVSVSWPSGIWQPAGLVISAVEDDGVGLDVITNAVIDVVRDLGLDPIQDTVKEGPAGLIARLERPQSSWVGMQLDEGEESALEALKEASTLEAMAGLDVSDIPALTPNNVGNVRGLIYPSGRAFLSYLYDTPFFNAIDEMIQHGNYHVRGKQDLHRLRRINISMFSAFYQGALANLMQDTRVQNNMGVLLRQMTVLWRTDGLAHKPRRGRIGVAIGKLRDTAADGIEHLHGLPAPALDAPDLPQDRCRTFLDEGVGVRYVTVNRYERLVRMALGVAFWRIAAGDMEVAITEGDCAVADAILHSHDMGARLLEIAASRSRFGAEAMRIFTRLLDGEAQAGESVAFASDEKAGADTLNRLAAMSVIDGEGKLADEYRFVSPRTMTAHAERWGIS